MKQQKWTYGWGISQALLGIQGSLLRHTIFPRMWGNETDIELFCKVEKGTASVYYTHQVSLNRQEYGRKFLGQTFLKRMLAASQDSRGSMTLWLEKINNENIKNATNIKLFRLLEGYFKRFLLIRTLFKLSNPEYFFYLESNLQKILTKKFDSIAAQKNFQSLITPEDFDQISQERIDWLKYILIKKPSKQFFISHISAYPWLAYNSMGSGQPEVFMHKKYILEKKQNNKSSLQTELKQFFIQKKQIRNEHKKILSLIPKNNRKNVAYLANAICNIGLERLNLKCFYGIENAENLLKEIATRSNIPFKTFLNTYRYEDMEGFLVKNIRLPQKELFNRKNSMAFFLNNKKLSFVSGARAKAMVKKNLGLQSQQINQISSVKGKTAHPGFVTGRARVADLSNPQTLLNYIKNFKKGDIIITSMTQPNAMMVIKKASAIVTDEGGIISHAAIVAREFKIPCIVGTNTATKVFKDGDVVEVDANKGIVRKL